ncbi:hypothetical protein KCP69_24315 [Salmonella enterica subsp. enterica]|nr:hypothetical protein KCP69_24315 [Salmonella enterica subsp. enterica]
MKISPCTYSTIPDDYRYIWTLNWSKATGRAGAECWGYRRCPRCHHPSRLHTLINLR